MGGKRMKKKKKRRRRQQREQEDLERMETEVHPSLGACNGYSFRSRRAEEAGKRVLSETGGRLDALLAMHPHRASEGALGSRPPLATHRGRGRVDTYVPRDVCVCGDVCHDPVAARTHPSRRRESQPAGRVTSPVDKTLTAELGRGTQ